MENDDVVARAEAALEGITPGPWACHDIGPGGAPEPTSIVVHTGAFDWEDLIRGEADSAVVWMPRYERQEYVNAQFIAAAPTYVRELADEVKKLRAAVDRVRGSVGRIARDAYVAMQSDQRWAEDAWEDMGGSEPAAERAELEAVIHIALTEALDGPGDDQPGDQEWPCETCGSGEHNTSQHGSGFSAEQWEWSQSGDPS